MLNILRRPGTTSNHTLILLSEVKHKLIEGKLQVSLSKWKKHKKDLRESSSSYHHEELSLDLGLVNQLRQARAIHPNDTSTKQGACSTAFLHSLLTKLGMAGADAKKVCDTIKAACQPGMPAIALAPIQEQGAAPSITPGMSLSLRQAMEAVDFPEHITFQVMPPDLPPMPDAELMASVGTNIGLGNVINTSPKAAALRQQCVDFHTHYSSPINAYRQGKHMEASTWVAYMQVIFTFFGIVHNVLGKPVELLSLWDCACPHYMALFLRIQQSRMNQTSLAQAASKLKGILGYLALNCLPGVEQDHLADITQWFSTLKAQVVHHARKPQSVNLQNLPSLFEVMHKQEQLMKKEMGRFKDYLRDPLKYMRALTGARGWGQQVQHNIIWDLQNITMFSTMFGHLPPTRIKALTSIKHHKFANTPCTECSQLGCTGNSLIEYPATATSSKRFALYLVHHKVANSATPQPGEGEVNSNCTSATPIQVDVPSTLQPLMELWVNTGWGLAQEFCLAKGDMGQHTKQLLFWNPTTERGFLSNEVSPWFKGMLSKAGFADHELFCPQMTRHLWITTMKVMKAAGHQVPNMAGQAHIMGHLPSQWDAPIYNLLLKQVEAKLAADGMASFRQVMLNTYMQQQEPGMTAAQTLEGLLHNPTVQHQVDAILQQEEEEFKLKQQLRRQQLISQLEQEQQGKQGQSPEASFQTCSSQGGAWDGVGEMEVEVEEVTSIERACNSA